MFVPSKEDSDCRVNMKLPERARKLFQAESHRHPAGFEGSDNGVHMPLNFHSFIWMKAPEYSVESPGADVLQSEAPQMAQERFRVFELFEVFPLFCFYRRAGDFFFAETRRIGVINGFPHELGITLAGMSRFAVQGVDFLLFEQNLDPGHDITPL